MDSSEVDDPFNLLGRMRWEVQGGAFQLASSAQRGLELTASKAHFLPNPRFDFSDQVRDHIGRDTGDRLKGLRGRLREMDLTPPLGPSSSKSMEGGGVEKPFAGVEAVSWVVQREVLEGVMTASDLLAQGIRGSHAVVQFAMEAVSAVDDAFDTVIGMFNPLEHLAAKKMKSVALGAASKVAQGAVSLGKAATPDEVKDAFGKGMRRIRAFEVMNSDWATSSYGIPRHLTTRFNGAIGEIAMEVIGCAFVGGAFKVVARMGVSRKIAGSCRPVAQKASFELLFGESALQPEFVGVTPPSELNLGCSTLFRNSVNKDVVRSGEIPFADLLTQKISQSREPTILSALEALDPVTIRRLFPETQRWDDLLYINGRKLTNPTYIIQGENVIEYHGPEGKLRIKCGTFPSILSEERAWNYLNGLELTKLSFLPPQAIFRTHHTFSIVQPYPLGPLFIKYVKKIVSSDIPAREDLLRVFGQKVNELGAGLGELHSKSHSGYLVPQESVQEIIDEILINLKKTNRELSKKYFGQLPQHPLKDLLFRFSKDPGPASFALNEVSLNQLVQTLDGIVITDIASVATSISPAGLPVGSAVYDLSNLVKGIFKTQGSGLGLWHEEMDYLKRCLYKGYQSKFPLELHPDVARLMMIDQHMSILRQLCQEIPVGGPRLTTPRRMIYDIFDQTTRLISGQL